MHLKLMITSTHSSNSYAKSTTKGKTRVRFEYLRSLIDSGVLTSGDTYEWLV